MDILTLLGTLGGLQSALFAIGALLIGFFTTKMLNSEIVKRIYQTLRNAAEQDSQDSAR